MCHVERIGKNNETYRRVITAQNGTTQWSDVSIAVSGIRYRHVIRLTYDQNQWRIRKEFKRFDGFRE